MPRCRLLAFSVMLLTPSWTGSRRQAAAIQWFLPRRSPSSGGCSRPLPLYWLLIWGCSERERRRPCSPTNKSGPGAVRMALGRGPRSLSQICGLFFRWRVLWPRSTEAGGPGLLRVAPAGKERRSPQRTVSVSPQCLQEIDLLTL